MLSSLKPSVLRAAIEKAPEKQMDYAAWKGAIKAAGGPTWLRMLRANVDASGHLKVGQSSFQGAALDRTLGGFVLTHTPPLLLVSFALNSESIESIRAS